MQGILVCNSNHPATPGQNSDNDTQPNTVQTEEPETPTHNNEDARLAHTNELDKETTTTQRQPPNLSTTNLWSNIPYGTDMQIPKPPNTTQLVDLNINGLRQTNDFQDVL
jgi:hypothetical protein